MENAKLNRELVLKLYMEWVENVPEEKSTFTPQEIVNEICNIIETKFVWQTQNKQPKNK